MPDDQPTRRIRFTLKQLFLLVALVAVGMAIGKWVFRKEVVVRAATAEEQLIDRHESWGNDRNAAVLTVRFMKGTTLTATTYLVTAGLVMKGETHFARSNKRERRIATVWMGLNDELVPGSPANSHLFFAFETPRRIGWDFLSSSRPIIHDFKTVAKQTVPGTITPGRPHIVYVEGDQWIVVDGSMTVEEFAKANPGDYLVVTVEVK